MRFGKSNTSGIREYHRNSCFAVIQLSLIDWKISVAIQHEKAGSRRFDDLETAPAHSQNYSVSITPLNNALYSDRNQSVYHKKMMYIDASCH
jgi:hypothetical protein